ncbi:MAG: metalloregulator ArsR/SmtB family transcription factor [Alphaproteobacteria bacterium]
MANASEQKILHLLKSQGPQTASQAGTVLGITTAGAQQNLAKLAEAGLIAAEDRKHGRGRPRRYWRLTDSGHGRFPDRHADLTLELLHATGAVFGEAGLERLIRHRETATLATYRDALNSCRGLKVRVKALAEVRAREGYMAEWSETKRGEYLLVENHCPICAAATLCQGFCRSEMEIFQDVLGPGARVERTDHILAGARRCAYRISRV